MFSAAMIDPLPSKRREFLAVMGLADEFTVEMAETVTGSKNTAAILQTLTEQNAFVNRLPDGVTFRFHHMMKDCAERTFHTMEPRRQAVYHNRYGEWYKTHGQYLHALKFYCLAKNYDAALLVIQRMGKAIKKPAKDTILSFAASQEGVGKSFGIQEVLDQIGAFLGPVLLYLVMLFKTDGTTFQVYSTCFAVLAIPGAITLVLLLVTKRKFPNPEHFEPEPKEYVPFKMKKEFVLYIAGISLFAFGFIDYSLVLMHVSRTYTHLASGLAQTSALVSSGSLPLLYAGAMLVDAVAALVFGLLYDKKGVQALVWSTVLSAPFAVFVFACHSVGALLVGIGRCGVGMGAEEWILKAAVTQMVPKASRATGYGVFECAFGVFWFLGSWLLGVLYDVSIPAMVAVSVAAQLAAIPLYLRSAKLYRDGLKGENA